MLIKREDGIREPRLGARGTLHSNQIVDLAYKGVAGNTERASKDLI